MTIHIKQEPVTDVDSKSHIHTAHSDRTPLHDNKYTPDFNDKSTSHHTPHDHHTLLHDKLPGEQLNAPINDLSDKWKLIPLYIQSKGLVRQHIDSYNYFIEHDMRNILQANNRVTTDTNDQFYLQYNNIYCGQPSIQEDISTTTYVTPQHCRLRDLTYSAPIYVDIEYTKAQQLIRRRQVCIGRMPIMLRSNICVLHSKSAEQIMAAQECIYDTGGYFIVRGQERAILIQEQ